MSKGSRWLLPVLIVLLIGLPIVEVWLLIEVGQRIGIVATLAILIAEALLGGWLLRREGERAWRALTAAFSTGRMPTGELADAALVLVGGVLLMLPGFITDVVGLVFLLPLTRPSARRFLGYLVTRRVNRTLGPYPRRRPDNLIEGETVDEPHPPTRPRTIRGEIDDGPRG